MHRFHIDPSVSPRFEVGARIELPKPVSHQIRNVLRFRSTEKVALFTGDGREWTAELTRVDGRGRASISTNVTLLEVSEPDVEMKTKVSMVMALTRPQRYELALAKCTELGAHEFIPVVTDRVLKSDATIGPNRKKRWNRIVTEAAELSGRVRVPTIADTDELANVISQLVSGGANVVLLWEGTNEPMLSDLLATLEDNRISENRIALVLGPVGGFAEDEAMRAIELGASPASLGRRVLRTETAAIAAMAIAAQMLP